MRPEIGRIKNMISPFPINWVYIKYAKDLWSRLIQMHHAFFYLPTSSFMSDKSKFRSSLCFRVYSENHHSHHHPITVINKIYLTVIPIAHVDAVTSRIGQRVSNNTNDGV
jgi:hypothetical protein